MKRLEVVRVIREASAWDLGAGDWAGEENERARLKGGRALYETVWACAARSGRDVRLGRVDALPGGLRPVARWVHGDAVLEVVEVRELAVAATHSPRRMAGPCANGFERNGGVRWHALPAGSLRALCGARSKSFWSDEVGKAVTCPRCLKKLAKLEPPAESPRHFDLRPASASAYGRALERARREHVCDDDCRSNGCSARFW